MEQERGSRAEGKRKSVAGQSYGMTEEIEGGGGGGKLPSGKANQMDRLRKRRSVGMDDEKTLGQAFSCRLGPKWAPPCPEVMGIQGMELFAIGVVIILFMAVLK
ncbi:hypothetical protein FQN60_018140, partial [Etheostoma spectabile]